MFNWNHMESVKTDATAAQIWSLWKSPQDWPLWDSELEWVKMDGPFMKGSTGTMKPRSGPIVSFELTTVEENRQFIDSANLPLTTMEFIHRYENMEDGSALIVHEVIMKGLLAPFFGLVIGTKIRAHLRTAMVKLSGLAVTQCHNQGDTK